MYFLRIVLEQRTFGVLFRYPPTRKDVDHVFRAEWNKLSEKQQDLVWEWMLLLERLPESGPVPPLTESIYGTLQVIEKAVVINEQEVPAVS